MKSLDFVREFAMLLAERHPMKLHSSIVPYAFFFIVLAATLPPASHAQTFTNGLVAFYPFNGNANDLSGNGNHGVASSVQVVPDRHGNADAAFLFAGNGGSLVKLTNTSAFELTGDFTVSAWIYFAGGTENPQVGSALSMLTLPACGTGLLHTVLLCFLRRPGYILSVDGRGAQSRFLATARRKEKRRHRRQITPADSFPKLVETLV